MRFIQSPAILTTSGSQIKNTTFQIATALIYSDTYSNGTIEAFYVNGTIAIFTSNGFNAAVFSSYVVAPTSMFLQCT